MVRVSGAFALSLTNIVDFGAKGDGATINTAAIQQAMDQTSEKGGGTLYIPAGVFLTGTIHFRSNITLYLDAGAVLKGSPNLEDYTNGLGLIYGEDLINIAIRGEGEINGNGSHFMEWGTLHAYTDFNRGNLRQGDDFLKDLSGAGEGPVAFSERPNMMLIFMHCEHVKIEGIRLVDAPHWTARIGNCENVVVHGVTILNNQMVPNSDGFHFTTSRKVRVSDCHIIAGDDALIVTGFGVEKLVNGRRTIPVKENYQYGNKSGIAEDIVVSNCVLSSRSAGIRIGYGDNDMRNCLFQNIIIRDSNRGVGLFARDQGSIDNITFSNFIIETRLFQGTWWGRGEPIHLSSISQKKDTQAGTISNITFKNFKIKSETGIVVWGAVPGAVNNVKFQDIDLHIAPGAHSADGGNLDLRPTASFDTNLFEKDLAGIDLYNADDILLKDIRLSWSQDIPPYFIHGIAGENFRNLQIDGFKGKQAGGRGAAIFLQNGSQIDIRNSYAEKATDHFLIMSDVQDRRSLLNNDLKNARTAVAPSNYKFDQQSNLK